VADNFDALCISLRINFRWIIAWIILLSLQMMLVMVPLWMSCLGGRTFVSDEWMLHPDVSWACEQASHDTRKSP